MSCKDKKYNNNNNNNEYHVLKYGGVMISSCEDETSITVEDNGENYTGASSDGVAPGRCLAVQQSGPNRQIISAENQKKIENKMDKGDELSCDGVFLFE